MQKIINSVKKIGKSKSVKKPRSKAMINGIPKYGSRSEVFHGNAYMTSGKLTKKDLVKNKHGYIKSKRKVQQAKDPKTNPLLKMGLLAKKGSKEFGPNLPQESNNSKSNNKSNSKSNNKSNSKSNNKSNNSKTNSKSNNNKKSKSKSTKFFGLF